MESDVEYIQLFMQYESDEMPVVFFYEVDSSGDACFCERDGKA